MNGHARSIPAYRKALHVILHINLGRRLSAGLACCCKLAFWRCLILCTYHLTLDGHPRASYVEISIGVDTQLRRHFPTKRTSLPRAAPNIPSCLSTDDIETGSIRLSQLHILTHSLTPPELGDMKILPFPKLCVMQLSIVYLRY